MTLRAGDSYTCTRCRRTFETVWSDEEALASYAETFPEDYEQNTPYNIVCDTCYNTVMAAHAEERERERERERTAAYDDVETQDVAYSYAIAVTCPACGESSAVVGCRYTKAVTREIAPMFGRQAWTTDPPRQLGWLMRCGCFVTDFVLEQQYDNERNFTVNFVHIEEHERRSRPDIVAQWAALDHDTRRGSWPGKDCGQPGDLDGHPVCWAEPAHKAIWCGGPECRRPGI